MNAAATIPASILPSKNGIWGKLAFTASLAVTILLLADYIRKSKSHKEERELLRLNLQKARADLGLHPITGEPLQQGAPQAQYQ